MKRLLQEIKLSSLTNNYYCKQFQNRVCPSIYHSSGTNVISLVNQLQSMKQRESMATRDHASFSSQFDLDIEKVIQCRICLQAHFREQEIFVTPCKCTGSLKYVHQSCMKAWIEKLIQNSNKKVDENLASICCELCKAKISFKTSSSLACKSSSQIGNTFKNHYKLFVLLLIVVILALGFFSALLNYLVFVGFRTLKENNVVIVSLVISGQVLFSLVVLITIGAIVKKFFLKNYLNIELLPYKDSKIQKQNLK